MVTLTENSHCTIVRMDDGKANALSLAFCDRLTETMREAEAVQKPVVLTGAGRIFSAGVDLPFLVREGEEYVRLFLPALDRAFAAVAFASVPVVAAVNGHAIAGGCVLTCACDYRVMIDRGASIGAPELRVGVPFPHLPFEIMRARVAPGRFREVVLLGKNYDPREALACGLVDVLAGASDLLPTAEEVAQQLGAVPRATFRFTKEQLVAPMRAALREATSEGDDPVTLWTSSAVTASIKEFIDTTIRGNARRDNTEETV